MRKPTLLSVRGCKILRKLYSLVKDLFFSRKDSVMEKKKKTTKKKVAKKKVIKEEVVKKKKRGKISNAVTKKTRMGNPRTGKASRASKGNNLYLNKI